MFEHSISTETAFQTITRTAYNLCSFYQDFGVLGNMEDERLIDLEPDENVVQNENIDQNRTENHSSGGFERLPYEIHSEVAKHLNLADICSVRLVSVIFSRIYDDPRIYEKLVIDKESTGFKFKSALKELTIFSDDEPESAQKSISESTMESTLKTPSESTSKSNKSSKNHFSTLLTNASQHQSKLLKLTLIGHFTSESLNSAFSAWGDSLESLIIRNVSSAMDTDVLETMSTKFKRLQHLEVVLEKGGEGGYFLDVSELRWACQNVPHIVISSADQNGSEGRHRRRSKRQVVIQSF